MINIGIREEELTSTRESINKIKTALEHGLKEMEASRSIVMSQLTLVTGGICKQHLTKVIHIPAFFNPVIPFLIPKALTEKNSGWKLSNRFEALVSTQRAHWPKVLSLRVKIYLLVEAEFDNKFDAILKRCQARVLLLTP